MPDDHEHTSTGHCVGSETLECTLTSILNAIKEHTEIVRARGIEADAIIKSLAAKLIEFADRAFPKFEPVPETHCADCGSVDHLAGSPAADKAHRQKVSVDGPTCTTCGPAGHVPGSPATNRAHGI